MDDLSVFLLAAMVVIPIVGRIVELRAWRKRVAQVEAASKLSMPMVSTMVIHTPPRRVLWIEPKVKDPAFERWMEER